MKKWFRLFLFLLAFQMEVRVRAAGDLIEQPAACLKAKETCAIQVTGPGFHFLKETVQVHASEGSTLVRLSESQWRFVKGNLWIEKGKGLSVETLYGNTQSTVGQYWLIEQGDRIVVRNMNADLKVTLRDGKTLEVPEGFEFWMSGLNSKGKSDFGMIQPIDMKEHLPLWNSLYRGSKNAFIKEVVHMRENWGDVTEKSSFIYKNVAQREIASEQAKQRAVELKKAREAAEREKTKAFFFQKVFGQ